MMGMLDKSLKLERTEMKVTILKKDYILKLNFAGIREMENRACTGSFGLLEKFAKKKWGLNDIASIIYGGIVGKTNPLLAPPITFEKLGQDIIDHGLADFVDPCNEILTFAITGKMPCDFTDTIKKKALKGSSSLTH